MSSQETGQQPQPQSGTLGRKERRKRADPKNPKEGLEDMLLSAHRIAVALGEMNAFRDAGVSVAEWAVLRTVGERKNVSLKEIGVVAGVSRQRIRKLLSDLQSKDLIAMGKAEGNDKRVRTISSTAGTARILATVSQQMQTLISSGQTKQTRRFGGAARTLDRLSRQLRRTRVSAKARQKTAAGAAADLDED